jgi:hypothetical protein
MPATRRPLRADLRRLEALQFRRAERCGDVVRALFKLRGKIGRHPLATQIGHLYDWLLCPLTLWAVDYEGIARHVVTEVNSGRDFDADLNLLLALLQPAPAQAVRDKIGEYERIVANGLYDHISRQPEKFLETETAHEADLVLRKFWNQMKSRFARHMKPNARGVVRRTLSRERNFNPYAEFKWRDPCARFQTLFDALCYRWCLYGFENDKPLLLKISVNPTPHGTMIVIPRHLSMDGKRGLDWKAINVVHRAHGTRRQGRKLSLSRIQQRADIAQAKSLDETARRRGLAGHARYEFVLRGMGQDLRRISWVKRLIYHR